MFTWKTEPETGRDGLRSASLDRRRPSPRWDATGTSLGLVLASLVGGALLLPSPLQAATVLKFAHNNNPGHPTHEAAVRFAELVHKKTNGELQVNIFPSSQLGRMNELWTGVKIGTIEIAGGTPPGMMADLLPELSIFDAPYMFKDLNHFRRVVEGPIGQELGRRLVETAGVRVLSYQYFGVRHMTTSNRSVRTPADVRGLKIRAVPTPILIATLEGMGAKPTPMDFAELYQALRTGVVDGQDNPVTSIFSAKFYEVQKYLIMTGHIQAVVATVINEKVYASLPIAARRALDEAGAEAASFGDEFALKQEAELLDSLRKAGMIVIAPDNGLDVEAFRKDVRAYVYPRFEAKWTRDLIERIQALSP